MTYWLAAVPIALLGKQAWIARLPNLLYALITALGVGLWRLAAPVGSQAWWQPQLSAPSCSHTKSQFGSPPMRRCSQCFGACSAPTSGSMQRTKKSACAAISDAAALAFGFLSKSAVAWMVPALAIVTLSIWEKRWRELLRWELYAGLAVQAAIILSWVWCVYAGRRPGAFESVLLEQSGRALRGSGCACGIAVRGRTP